MFFAGFFIGDRVELRGFFSWLPIYLSVFVPALTMRIFSEEKRSGSIETLMTLPVTEFDEKNDCAVVDPVANASYVTCQPGMFVIFFPQDAHAPGILEVSEVHKLIFKVRV